MGDKLTVDKVFADNLGTAIGGCVRDQSVTLFSSDIARAAGVPWNPIPFFGRAEKTRFRARWAALTAIPELAAEEKLSRKVSSQMQAYTDAILKSPLLEALSEAEVRDYTLLRQRFMRLGASPEASKDAFARAFLSALSGKSPAETSLEHTRRLSEEIGAAYSLFTKLSNACKAEPLSYERASKKKS